MKRWARSIKQWLPFLLLVSLTSVFHGIGEVVVSHAAALVGQSRTLPLPVSGSHAFISYKSESKVGCREATQDEANALKRRGNQSLHVISPTGKVRKQSLSTESVGLQIVLRATDQLEGYPAAKAAFLNAALNWRATNAALVRGGHGGPPLQVRLWLQISMGFRGLVPKGGLEPPRVAPYAPQTYVSTNSTTSAHSQDCWLPSASDFLRGSNVARSTTY
jgi:hypothetical protein